MTSVGAALLANTELFELWYEFKRRPGRTQLSQDPVAVLEIQSH